MRWVSAGEVLPLSCIVLAKAADLTARIDSWYDGNVVLGRGLHNRYGGGRSMCVGLFERGSHTFIHGIDRL